MRLLLALFLLSCGGGNLPLGAACDFKHECASKFCEDNRCCDRRCKRACERCDYQEKLGTCSVSEAGEPGWPACAPLTCDGVHPWCVWAGP